MFRSFSSDGVTDDSWFDSRSEICSANRQVNSCFGQLVLTFVTTSSRTDVDMVDWGIDWDQVGFILL